MLLNAAGETQLVMLGTGTPRPDPDRSGPAAAVLVRGASYLVDCGPGIVRRASAARAKGLEELAPSQLKTVFVTHLHSDHTVGLVDLILTPWVVGRKEPLSAFGPVGLKHMVGSLLEAYREDIQLRIHGLENGNDTGWKVKVTEVQPGVIFKDDNVTVTAISVRHGSWKEALGYSFKTDDRTIVFSGDTAPCPELEAAAKGADILVHEVYEDTQATPEPRPGGDKWPAYMKSFHTSASELGAIAARTKPKLLLLTHVLIRKGNEAKLIQEIRAAGFEGDVKIADDLGVY